MTSRSRRKILGDSRCRFRVVRGTAKDSSCWSSLAESRCTLQYFDNRKRKYWVICFYRHVSRCRLREVRGAAMHSSCWMSWSSLAESRCKSPCTPRFKVPLHLPEPCSHSVQWVNSPGSLARTVAAGVVSLRADVHRNISITGRTENIGWFPFSYVSKCGFQERMRTRMGTYSLDRSQQWDITTTEKDKILGDFLQQLGIFLSNLTTGVVSLEANNYDNRKRQNIGWFPLTATFRSAASERKWVF